MATMEVPRQQWPEFLTTFSDNHQGFALRIERLDPEQGPQVLAAEQVLEGISMDAGGTGAETIRISGRDDRGGFESHVVARPGRIKVQEDAPGSDAALEIGSADGESVLVLLGRREELPH